MIMCKFCYEAMVAFIHLVSALDVNLGPGTGDLALRAGIRK